MNKLLRGDILVFTNNGLMRLDTIKKEDKILAIDNDNNYYYEEIEEISKVFKKKYKLNKIDNIYLNDNIEVKAIKNIPYNYDIKEINNLLDENKNKYYQTSSIGDLSEFDFIGFPLNNELNKSSYNNDYYRYQGLILISQLKFNNEYDKSTIEFLNNYLKTEEINYEIKKDSFSTSFEIFNEKKLILDDIFKLTIDELNEFMSGIIENSNEFKIKDNDIYKIIKFTCILLGVAFTSYYKDGLIHIKILKEDKNKFIFNKIIWNKIKYIKKTEYTGNLYSLKLKSNNYYLTEFGLIS
jgi:hypothetical protein